MSTTSESLLLWVIFMQMNTFQLDYSPKDFPSLSDGIFLFTLFSNMYFLFRSSSHFDKRLLCYDIKDNWALKLSNLRQLQNSVIGYLHKLNIPTERLPSVNLSVIARGCGGAEMMKLLEIVVFTMINCPDKDKFVHKMMELPPESQTSLMFFIKKILNEESDTEIDEYQNFDEVHINRREFEGIRDEKIQMVEELERLRKALEGSDNETALLRNEKKELNKLVHSLELQLHQIEVKINPDEIELENQLAEANLKLSTLHTHITSKEREFNFELNSLRDELDLAQSKLLQFGCLENTVDLYKKQLETTSAMRTKNHELEGFNESLKSQIALQKIELEELVKLKQLTRKQTVKHNSVKEKVSFLNISVGNANKELHEVKTQYKVLKQCDREKQSRILLLEKELSNLEELLNNKTENNHEDSLSLCNKNFFRSESFTTLNSQIDTFSRQVRNLEFDNSILSKQLRECKETSHMLLEELHTQIQTFQEKDFEDSTEVTHDSCKQSIISLQGKLDSATSSNKYLQVDLSSLFLERETLYNTVSSQAQALNDSSALLLQKTNLLSQQDLELAQFRVTSPCSSETDYLTTQLKQKDVMILKLQSTRHSIDVIEKGHSNQVSRMKEDHERSIRRLITQTEEAVIEIQTDRDKYIQLLQSEQRNELKRAVTKHKSNTDYQKLVKIKGEEIKGLVQANKQLKTLWKESNNTLQIVYQELGMETSKFRSAIAKRKTLTGKSSLSSK